MVRNDSDDLRIKDRRMGSGKLDHLLKARTSTLLIATRKNENPDFPAACLHLYLL
jgi:hypothetical protein